MKLLSLLLAIAFFLSIDARFRCPKDLACPCNAILDMNEHRIHCVTSARQARVSTFDLVIQPEEVLRVRCRNSPDWTDFLLGATIDVGSVRKVAFEGCAPPTPESDVNTSYLLDQMNVNGVGHLRYVNLMGQLRPADLEAFPELKYLKLSYNNLSSLDPLLLTGLPHLEHLELDNANVKIPDGFFDKSSTIKRLELGGNHLKTLKPGVFDGLKSIQLLNLWGNELTELQPELFRNLSSLVSLDIHRNNLTSFPAEVFAGLKNLSLVNFSHNNFSSLPKDLFLHNPKLNTVKLLNNRGYLMSLPSGLLANLTNLKAVTLFRSGLTSLPEDLFWGSSALLDLNLNRNLLTTLPAALFRDTVELLTLKASFNEFSDLPDGIFENAKKMVFLDLSKNHLKSITDSTLIGLESLRELDMEENELEFIDVDAFSSVTQLKIARFGKNRLTLKTNLYDFFGQASPFMPCYALEKLHLSHNNISEMFGDWVISHTSLRELDLSHNAFEYLEMADLQFTSNRIRVDLRYNNISQIDFARLEFAIMEKALSNIPNSYGNRDTQVELEENPIECNCELYSFLHFINNKMPNEVSNFVKIDKNELICAGPDHMAGTKLMDIDLSTFKCPVESNNLIPEDPCALESACDCWFRPTDQALILDCAEKNLTYAPSMINVTGVERVELDLSRNYLVRVPNMFAPGYEIVSKLSLSDNNIGYIDENLITSNLQVLDLNNNNLTSLDTKVLDKISNSTQMESLSLRENPWLCDCSSLELLSFLHSEFQRISDFQNISCANSQNSLADLSVDDLCPNLTVVIYCVLSSMAVLLFLSAALYYRFQQKIKIWLYSKDLCLCLITEDKMDRNKIYDAFVSYSHKDEDFVLKELVSPLESGPKPYRICVHCRDWLAGEWIPMQIARSVEDSKRTIIVLTPNFVESIWGRLEFQAAHKQALKEKRNRVIIIVRGEIGPIDDLDPELKAYLQMNTYIKWSDPWFWQKLKYAMPHTYQMSTYVGRKDSKHLTAVSEAIAEEKMGKAPSTCNKKIKNSRGIWEAVSEINRDFFCKFRNTEEKYQIPV